MTPCTRHQVSCQFLPYYYPLSPPHLTQHSFVIRNSQEKDILVGFIFYTKLKDRGFFLWIPSFFLFVGLKDQLYQGAKVGTLGRQNERNSSNVWLAYAFIIGLCFMFGFLSVCLMKSNCFSLIYSSLSYIEVWLSSRRLLSWIPIQAVFQNLRWFKNKIVLLTAYFFTFHLKFDFIVFFNFSIDEKKCWTIWATGKTGQFGM